MSSNSQRPSFALPLVLGVDVGGTKIAASLVDAQGKLLGLVRSSTDVSNPQATLDSIAAAAEQAIAVAGVERSQLRGVGLGIPGLVDAQRGIGLASVNLGWRDVPVRAHLEQRLGLPCFIENDVRAAALGEYRFGAGRGLESMVYLVLGTGIAAALVLHGKVYSGSHGMAGEIGHAMIEVDGPQCKCGGHGCFEALASGPAIAARAAQKIQAGGASLLGGAKGGDLSALSAEQVFKAAEQADELARETVRQAAGYIAFVIQFLALGYDPQMFVLGGGVPKAGATLLDPLLQTLSDMAQQNWVFRQLYHPGLIQLSQLGDEIGILGAAALVPVDA